MKQAMAMTWLLVTLSTASAFAADTPEYVKVPGLWPARLGDANLQGGGTLWYRCYVKVPDKWFGSHARDLWAESVTLSVEQVAEAHEVWVNGAKIASVGSFPPDFKSGSQAIARHKIPKGTLKKGEWNVIAFRVHSPQGPGGFRGPAPVISGYEDDIFMDNQWETTGKDDASFAAGPYAPTAGSPLPPEPVRYDKFVASGRAMQRPSELQGGPRLSPEESLAKMKPADDLAVDQILAEPLVGQPVYINFDGKGRLWVVEYRQYPYPSGLKMISRNKWYRAIYDKAPPAPPHHDKGDDRITVHEDRDGDGKFETHSVFADGLNMVTAALPGRGGVWVLNPPYMLFYSDQNGDAKPDADPQVVLSGFGLEDTHAVVNSLRWGPDGWLYGAQGSSTTAKVFRPGDKEPVAVSEGTVMWRYHPEKKIFENFCEGGSGNAFGSEIDSKGRLWCGDNHPLRGTLHIQGAYYDKGAAGKFGPSSNPYAFGVLPRMKSQNPIERFSHHFILYEADALPQRYHGKMISVDPLHSTVILSELLPVGAYFETRDLGFLLESQDVAFRPIDAKVGPDGYVYVSDFYECYIAHGQHFQGQIDPSTGRVYRLRSRDAKFSRPVDLTAKSTDELVDLLAHPNRYYRDWAKVILGDRKDKTAVPRLLKLLEKETGQLALDALWALNLVGGFNEAVALRAVDHDDPYVRQWAIRLVGDENTVSPAMAKKLAARAAGESYPEVRSQLAATARRLPVDACLAIARGLLQHDEDQADLVNPLLIWWAVESKAGSHTQAVLALLKDSTFWDHALVTKTVAPHLMRRFAQAGTQKDLAVCAEILRMAPKREYAQLLMPAFEEAFKGRSIPPLPPPLIDAIAAAGVQESLMLRLRRGDVTAADEAMKAVNDPKMPLEHRAALIESFGELKLQQALPLLTSLASKNTAPPLRKSAFAALQHFDEPSLAADILKAYPAMPADVKPAAQNLLASREPWALAFMQAIDAGRIDAKSVEPDVVERLRVYASGSIADLAGKHFGSPRKATTDEMRAEIERLSTVIRSGPGNPYEGRTLFMTSCAACHRMFSQGGAIGPDLTNYKRDDVPTMLLHIVNPNAEIREGFENYLITTADERILTGFLADQDARLVVLRGIDGQNVSLSRDQIREMKPAGRSLMPEGLIGHLTDQQVRDLFAYLRTSQPVN